LGRRRKSRILAMDRNGKINSKRFGLNADAPLHACQRSGTGRQREPGMHVRWRGLLKSVKPSRIEYEDEYDCGNDCDEREIPLQNDFCTDIQLIDQSNQRQISVNLYRAPPCCLLIVLALVFQSFSYSNSSSYSFLQAFIPAAKGERFAQGPIVMWS
jgi:hypothetical protein